MIYRRLDLHRRCRRG